MRPWILLAMLLATNAHAQEVTRLVASSRSAVVLEGSSNLATWRCRTNEMNARMLVATSPEHLNAVIDRIEDGNIGVWRSTPARGRFPLPEFDLTIPATAFRCGNRVMETDLRRALKTDAHPVVRFTFASVREIEHDIKTNNYRATIRGDLSLAGVTRTIDLTVAAERLSRTTFHLHASLPLRMTDFGITPPSALFGAIRARNELTVHFDLYPEIVSAGR